MIRFHKFNILIITPLILTILTISCTSSTPEAQFSVIEAYLLQGIDSHIKGDYDRAIENFNNAIQLDPDYAEAYHNRGLVYVSKGDYDRAIVDYDKAIQLLGSDPNAEAYKAYYNRGNAYTFKGDYDHAIADFDKAIQLRPDYAEAYYIRGLLYIDKQEKEKAIEDLKKYLELGSDPNFRREAEATLSELEAK